MLNSIPVVIDYDRPGYVLPLDLPLRPEFRVQFNAWAAGFFRRKPSFIKDGEVITTNPDGVPGLGPTRFHMNERTFAQFRKATA